MKRKDALNAIMVYTAKGQHMEAMRIYTENRVSFAAFKAAQKRGYAYREAHPDEFEEESNELFGEF